MELNECFKKEESEDAKKPRAWISLIHPSSHARCSPGKIQHDSLNETVRGEVLMEVEGESPDSELEF